MIRDVNVSVNSLHNGAMVTRMQVAVFGVATHCHTDVRNLSEGMNSAPVMGSGMKDCLLKEGCEKETLVRVQSI